VEGPGHGPDRVKRGGVGSGSGQAGQTGSGPGYSGQGFFEQRCGRPEKETVCILVGDVSSSNNVAFTEAYRLSRLGAIDLWIVGHDDDVARRTASKVMPDLSQLKDAVKSAVGDLKKVDILVNPEETHRLHGKAGQKTVLDALAEFGGEGLRVTLLWNRRNSGYLLSKVAGVKSERKRGKPDIFLDVGVEDGITAHRIVWGMKTAEKSLTIPLATELFVKGRTYPSGQESLQIGSVDVEGLRSLSLLL
jgi:hypothetical protein